MTSVAVLFDHNVYYIAQEPGSKVAAVDIPVGSHYPAHATSVGKVLLAGLPFDDLRARLDSLRLVTLTSRTIRTKERLLAELERVREQGWVVSDSELEEGLRGVAVPVRDRQARVVAAVNASLQVDETPEAVVRRDIVPALVSTAKRIEATLARGGGNRTTMAAG